MRLATLLILGGVFVAQIAMVDPARAETDGAETDAAEIIGDRANGRKIARQCQTCHGMNGLAKMPIAPHIGGEPKAYLVHQLTAFREGDRYHEMMSVVASGLDDQSIADVAAWYAGHHPSAGLKAGVDPAAAPEACTACHGVNGLAEIDDAPNLAGETVMYIDTQLKAFRLGKRQHDIMSDIAAGLTDAEIRAYAQWYSDAFFTVDIVD